MPLLPQIDGFPLAYDDPDREIHQQINAYFAGPGSWPGPWTAGQILPRVPIEQRYRWLMPLLRRAEWLLEHPVEGWPDWPRHLSSGAALLLNHQREQSEGELITLLGYSSVFRRCLESHVFADLMPRVTKAHKRSADRALWTPALQSAYTELEEYEEDWGGRFAVSLGALLLENAAFPANRSCWSQVVVSGLAAMKKKDALPWRSLFAAVDMNINARWEGKPAKVAAIVERIGAGRYAERLVEWTRPLTASDRVHDLSWFGVGIVRRLVLGASYARGSEAALEALAQARWRQPERGRLFADLLANATTSLGGAARILEPLAISAPESSALHVALVAPAPEGTVLGVDGYPLDARPEHAMFHRRMDEWFRVAKPMGEDGPDLRSLAMTLSGQPDYTGLLGAMLDRLSWIRRQAELIPNHSSYRLLLGDKFHPLIEQIDHIDGSTLIQLVESEIDGAFWCSPVGAIFRLLKRCEARHGLANELRKSLLAWHQSLHGTIAAQSMRQKVGWWLWLEGVMPVSYNQCWSAHVRGDLERMTEPAASRWRALLSHMTFALTDAPPAKFRKECKADFEAIGTSQFAERFHQWLSPFSQDAPVPLEVAGRDLLRTLFWHAAAVADPRIDEALAWFPRVAWKNKKSEGYSSKLIGPYVHAAMSRSPEQAHACLEALAASGKMIDQEKHHRAYVELCSKLGKTPVAGRPAAPRKTPDQVLAQMLGRWDAN